MSEGKKKIVIVGGGIAGLSAGIYGKLAGYDVEIFEKILWPAASAWDGTGRAVILTTAFTGSPERRRERRSAMCGKQWGHMEFLDCWTPLTYEQYCNAYHGAYMGFITRKGVKSFRVKGVVKGIKNLYIASQWIMAPGGLPVAVTAGKFAIWRIVRKP